MKLDAQVTIPAKIRVLRENKRRVTFELTGPDGEVQKVRLGVGDTMDLNLKGDFHMHSGDG